MVNLYIKKRKDKETEIFHNHFKLLRSFADKNSKCFEFVSDVLVIFCQTQDMTPKSKSPPRVRIADIFLRIFFVKRKSCVCEYCTNKNEKNTRYSFEKIEKYGENPDKIALL